MAVDDVTLKVPWFRYVNRDGDTVFEEPNSWRYSSWSTIYRGLLGQFGEARYHRGEALAAIEQTHDGVEVQLESGRVAACDLLVCADGSASTTRQLLMPAVRPEYAGYVGWHGMIAESDVADAARARLGDTITYFNSLAQPVPDLPDPVARRVDRPGRAPLQLRVVPQLLRGEAAGPVGRPRRCRARLLAAARSARRAAPRGVPSRCGGDPAAEHRLSHQAHPRTVPAGHRRRDRPEDGRRARVPRWGRGVRRSSSRGCRGTAKASSDAWALAEALTAAGGDVAEALSRWEP
ncbi:MAG: hypothetical protein OXG37_12485 [Actinomycetia bacterium]|nr:hypothetical protein [Actinomycetes bacterium]